jgi:hypothetical protein
MLYHVENCGQIYSYYGHNKFEQKIVMVSPPERGCFNLHNFNFPQRTIERTLGDDLSVYGQFDNHGCCTTFRVWEMTGCYVKPTFGEIVSPQLFGME